LSISSKTFLCFWSRKYSQSGQGRPPTRTRRFVHLTINQHGAFQHTRGPHLGQQFVPFARPFANACKDRNTFIFFNHGADQFHHQNGLSDACATKHRGLATLRHRRQQVDYFDAGFEYISGAGLGFQRGW
jgi:hypothetical protein